MPVKLGGRRIGQEKPSDQCTSGKQNWTENASDCNIYLTKSQPTQWEPQSRDCLFSEFRIAWKWPAPSPTAGDSSGRAWPAQNAAARLKAVAGDSYLTALLRRFFLEGQSKQHVSTVARHHPVTSQIPNAISHPLDGQKWLNLTVPHAWEAVDEYVYCSQECKFMKHLGNIYDHLIVTYCTALAPQRNSFMRRHVQKCSQQQHL